MRRLAILVVLLALGGCVGREHRPDVDAPTEVRLEEVASGFSDPVYVTPDPDDDGRVLVVEQVGRVVSMGRDGSDRRNVLDILDRVGSGGERGLFAVAHKDGRLFVHYTDKSGDTVVSSFAYQDGAADEDSEAVFLRQDQPYSNHNGGQILFGPDGYLYIGLGDGGSGGDPQGNGQDLSTLLGKILRIEVDGGTTYRVPDDNPFRGRSGARGEVWAYGLRNPWRFSFDAVEDHLFIGDVGQNQWEEIDFLRAGAPAGANFGWNRFEGDHPFRAGGQIEHTPPIHEYPTGPGNTCAVTGGYVYRGSALEALQGWYVFGDYCSGVVWALHEVDGDWRLAELLRTDHRISSFGVDAAGELYLVHHGGAVYRLVGA